MREQPLYLEYEKEIRQLRESHAGLLAFVKRYVREWDDTFEGQDTVFEGTPLEEFAITGRKLITKAEKLK